MRLFVVPGVMLLGACTPSSRPVETRGQTTELVREGAPVLEPVAREAAPESTATVPANEEWWCLCYQLRQEVTDAFTEWASRASAGNVTACRASENACHALMARAAEGTSSIAAGSVRASCQTIGAPAEHPGDRLGGRNGWSTSAAAKGFVRRGACDLLLDAPLGFRVVSLGRAQLGMRASDLVALFGEPSTKGPLLESTVEWSRKQDWSWPELGLTAALSFGVDSVTGGIRDPAEGVVFELRAEAASPLVTERGLAVGASREEFERLYPELVAIEAEVEGMENGELEADDPFEPYAGTDLDSLEIEFTDDRVSAIELAYLTC